jgi:ankyrin repeat protein
MEWLPDGVLEAISGFLDSPVDYWSLRTTSTIFRTALSPFFIMNTAEYFSFIEESCVETMPDEELSGHDYFRRNMSAVSRIRLVDTVSDAAIASFHDIITYQLRPCSLGQSGRSVVANHFAMFLSSCDQGTKLCRSQLVVALFTMIAMKALPAIIRLAERLNPICPHMFLDLLDKIDSDAKARAAIVKPLWSNLGLPNQSAVLTVDFLRRLSIANFKSLVSCGADVSLISLRDTLQSELPLDMSLLSHILKIHPETVSTLQDPIYFSLAVGNDNWNIARLLRSHGASVDPSDCLRNIRSARMARFLIEHCDFNINDEEGTVLLNAVRRCETSYLRQVLKLGLAIGGPLGLTALRAAIGRENITKVLVSYGADLNAVDANSRQTILHICCKMRPPQLSYVRTLLQLGAHVNAIDVRGNTPLILSVFSNNIDVTKLLLSRGAIADLVNSDGETALSIANACRHIEHVIVLTGLEFNGRKEKIQRCS